MWPCRFSASAGGWVRCYKEALSTVERFADNPAWLASKTVGRAGLPTVPTATPTPITLVVTAAGLGRRFGGNKPIALVGPCGESQLASFVSTNRSARIAMTLAY